MHTEGRILPPNPASFSFIRHIAVFFAATGAVFLNGGAPQGAAGIFLAVAGAVLLLVPPGQKVVWKWFLLAAALLGCGSLAFLPQEWLPAPEWRHSLLAGAIPLNKTVTTVTKESLFWVGLLTISAILLINSLAQPLHSRQMLILATVGLLVVSIYSALAIWARMTGWHYRFDFDNAFGFFPNRNNTAAFLVSGSMLGLGVLGVACRGNQWLLGTLAAAGLAMNASALFFFSGSRGGVVFLIFGTLLWLIGLGRRHWSQPVLTSFVGILCAGLILFAVSNGEARQRLFSGRAADGKNAARPATAEPEISTEGRLLIYQDTLKMIRDFPVTGVGLGAFRYVFPFYREDSLTEARSIHPESDWLMLAAEAGLPALLVAGGGLYWLLRSVLRERDHPYWPLRWGMVCAVLAVILHGVVDVPAHRVALGWWVLVLAGAGFARFPRNWQPAPVGQRLIYSATGLAAIVLGVLLIRAEWFGGKPLPPWAAEKAQLQIDTLSKQGKDEEAMDFAARAIRQSPMAYDLYYMEGVLKLNFENTDAEVESLFAAQRALSPSWPQISIEQGQAWLNWDQARAASVWQDALERQRRIDQAQGRKDRHDYALFERLLALSPLRPDLQQRLLIANQADRKMVMIWLDHVDKALAGPEILRFSRDEAFLATLDAPQRSHYLRIWAAKAELPALYDFIASHPAWAEAGWPWTIRQMVDAQRFQAAVEAVESHCRLTFDFDALLAAAPQTLPGSGGNESLFNDFVSNWRTGNQISARRILREARQSSSGQEVPAEIWQMSAALSIQEGRWEEAWPMVVRYLQKSGVDGAADIR